MIDFHKKLREGVKAKKLNPIEIYNMLDRQTDAGPLRPVQERILEDWFDNRKDEKNLIVKLHTGEGKTLIGLLILQSLLNINGEPALYLCPNEYLVTQTCREAQKFGIKFCTFDHSNNRTFPTSFLNGDRILITTVQKLFNGKTIFGIDANFTHVGSIVLDDSHSCIDSIKSSFSIRIDRKKDELLYEAIEQLFYEDLNKQGEGTLLNILKGASDLLQIPYWAWIDKKGEVLKLLGEHSEDISVKFSWPLLMDRLDNCQAFITGRGIEISPIYCPIEKFGSFANAPHRIFMSATTQDDSFFIKGFGFKEAEIMNPLADKKLKWSGEKMILFPSLVDDKFTRGEIIRYFSNENLRISRFAIVPSNALAIDYDHYGCHIANRKNIDSIIDNIRRGNNSVLNVLINRYDGINLPDNDCRILILDSLPFCDNLADRYEMTCREESEITILKQVQKIEQGLGRSVRGEKDYSVIIIIGADLVNFMMNHHSAKYFSEQTRKQIEIAEENLESIRDELSGDTSPSKELVELIKQCLKRDSGWKEYYQEQMNTIEKSANKDYHVYSIIAKERDYEIAAYKRDYTKACRIVSEIICQCKGKTKEQAWYKQILARYKYFDSQVESIHIQKSAFEENQYLLYPKEGVDYQKMEFKSAEQLSNIKEWLNKFHDYKEMRIYAQSILDRLSFGRPSSQFEQALKEVGDVLGFESQRPDNEYRVGPDNLWCGVHNSYIFFECKDEVSSERPINKDEVGQMNNHCAWFEEKYGHARVLRIFITRTNVIGRNTNLTHNVKVIPPPLLNKFKDSIDKFLREFYSYDLHDLTNDLIQNALMAHKLLLDDIKNSYTVSPIKEKV